MREMLERHLLLMLQRSTMRTWMGTVSSFLAFSTEIVPSSFSGAIDFEEFMTVMKIEHGVLAQSLWKHYDKNNDSSIDFREFITRLAESLSIKSMDDRAEWAFELYDLDRDGILTLKEIADSLNDKNVGIPWDREQLKSIFSDESIRDDKVTKDEFLRVAKTCSTLIFPAFIMLDTVKAKVFMYQSKKNITKAIMQKDFNRAARDKAAMQDCRAQTK